MIIIGEFGDVVETSSEKHQVLVKTFPVHTGNTVSVGEAQIC